MQLFTAQSSSIWNHVVSTLTSHHAVSSVWKCEANLVANEWGRENLFFNLAGTLLLTIQSESSCYHAKLNVQNWMGMHV